MIKVVLRVDAGPGAGLGHLYRSMSVAAALRARNTLCIFLTDGEGPCLRLVQDFGFKVVPLGSIPRGTSQDVERTLEVASTAGSDVVVVDSYHVGAEYLEALGAGARRVAVIDDLAAHPFTCSLVINGNADASGLPYCSSSGRTRFLLGPTYVNLREEFWEMIPSPPRQTVRHVLVTAGGADPTNLTPGLIRMLDEMPEEFLVTVVVGPFFSNQVEIEEAARDSRHQVVLARSPATVAVLMRDADLAISAAGQTLYELACVGCPTIAVAVASNQAGHLRALAEAGAVHAAGHAGAPDALPRVAAACLPLLKDPLVRARMNAAGPRMVDGRGALRVAQAILEVTGGA
jgi:UDP-2,4-diacetamido-2,4,6-trideoxy-beta-L-altropyranose hydrolase